MKKFFKLAVAAAAIVLVGCGRSAYPVKSVNLSQTEVVLARKNFRVIGNATGSSSAGYVLGVIGGLSQKAAKENAISNMFKNARLTGAQTIVNINVKSPNTAYFFFYSKKSYTATGVIIEYIE